MKEMGLCRSRLKTEEHQVGNVDHRSSEVVSAVALSNIKDCGMLRVRGLSSPGHVQCSQIYTFHFTQLKTIWRENSIDVLTTWISVISGNFFQNLVPPIPV